MPQLGQVEHYLIHEFIEDWEDGLLTRRGMVRRVVGITGGVATAANILTFYGVEPAHRASAQQPAPAPIPPQSPLSVPADDARISGQDVTFAGNGIEIMAYEARRAGSSGLLPLILVCHENRGLTDHIRDVARRWAVEGYLAVAVDLLSREGGTAAISDPADAPGLLTNGVDMNRHVDDFRAALNHYLAIPGLVDANRIAMQGFCFGGGITWRAATRIPELKAAAPYYGPPPPLEDVQNIEAAVMGVYSDDPNDFANRGLDELTDKLLEHGIVHEIRVYPGTMHAFHNDTSARYNAVQAAAAWADNVAWFRKHLELGSTATPTA